MRLSNLNAEECYGNMPDYLDGQGTRLYLIKGLWDQDNIQKQKYLLKLSCQTIPGMDMKIELESNKIPEEDDPEELLNELQIKYDGLLALVSTGKAEIERTLGYM